MAEWDVYRERIRSYGENQRARNQKRIIYSVMSLGASNPSYHKAMTDYGEIDLFITSTQTGTVKRFATETGNNIEIGDYILYNGHYWIVTEREHDDEVYIRGKISECNYQLSWQNASGEIVKRWCVIDTISKYNNGVFEGRVIDNIEETITAMMKADDETVVLKRGKRFIADVIQDKPYVYKITQRDVLSKRFGDHGIVTLALYEDVFNDATDNVNLMIADYKEFDQDPSGIIGVDTLRLGQTYIFTSAESNPSWDLFAPDMDGFSWQVLDVNRLEVNAPTERKYIGNVIRICDGVSVKDIVIRGVY